MHGQGQREFQEEASPRKQAESRQDATREHAERQAIRRDSDIWRVGLTASRKIGNAVCRNRARRRMRALARQHLATMARPGIDYVLIARHDTIYCDWQDLVTGLTKAIRYLHHKLPDQDLVSS